MNARALSRIGEPVCIEDAMAYAELQADNKALRASNKKMLAALRKIQGLSVRRDLMNCAHQHATIAIQQVEGIE